MADTTQITPAGNASRPAPLPTITVPAAVTAAVKAHVAKHGPLPTVAHKERVAFGHAYAAGTFTNTTDHGVQALVFALRNLGGPGAVTYRTIAVAIGAQCSALTERAAGAHARRGKVDASTWRTNTGGRAAKAAAAVPAPTK
jgi:hypothetical protein